MTPKALADLILQTPHAGHRRLVAIAGPPASGKSTLAARLADLIPKSRVVPMDGYHLDNATLDAQGTRDRKGAPHTFDVQSFASIVERARNAKTLPYALFDRTADRTLPDAATLDASVETVLFEGNYLLHDAPHSRDLAPHWDFSIFLEVPLATLETRLTQRWRAHNHTQAQASARAHHNDLPNAKAVLGHRMPADLTVTEPD